MRVRACDVCVWFLNTATRYFSPGSQGSLTCYVSSFVYIRYIRYSRPAPRARACAQSFHIVGGLHSDHASWQSARRALERRLRGNRSR